MQIKQFKLCLTFILFLSLFSILSLNAATPCNALLKTLSAGLENSGEKLIDKFDFSQHTAHLIDLGFSKERIQFIERILDQRQADLSIDRFIVYLKFVSMLKVEERESAFRDLLFLDIPHVNGPYLAKFYETQKMIDQQLKEKLSWDAKKVIWKNDFKSRISSDTKKMSLEERLATEGQFMSRFSDARLRFEDLFYSCQSRLPNKKHDVAKRYYEKFKIILGVGVTTSAYIIFNRDKGKTGDEWYEHNSDWYKRLLLEIAYAVISNKISVKVSTKESDSQFMKTLKNFVSNRFTNAFEAGAYAAIFTTSDKEARDRVYQILNTPKFQEDLNHIVQKLESDSFFDRFKTTLLSKLHMGANFNLKEILPKDIDFSNLTDKELKRSDVQEVITLVALMGYYDAHKGRGKKMEINVGDQKYQINIPPIDTGSGTLDRYTYSAVINAAVIPLLMFQQQAIYQTLCRGQDEIVSSTIKALGIYSAIKVINDTIFFSMRRDAINQ